MLLFAVMWAALASAGDAHPCERPCRSGVSPMTCVYHFRLEWYQVLSKACYSCFNGTLSDCLRPDCISADGVPRAVAVVNRQLPGPSISVCEGDHVVVDLENRMALETGSLHWHGHHQRGSPHMDGVPYVTQCPVLPGATFRYVFFADNPGTHFWHSHSGVQRGDGVSGPLIIRRARDPHASLYDRDDHVVHLADWLHETAMSKFVNHHHGDGDNKPDGLLINGRGRLDNETNVPVATFTLVPGLRHRFRVINSGFLNCPLELSIDNHTLLVIASDGADLQPIEVESLVSYAGERFDFVVHADQPVSAYWMRVRGLMDCDERFNSVHQAAIVAYEGSEEQEPPELLGYHLARRAGKQLNSLNTGSNDEDPETLSMAETSSLLPGDLDLIKSKPDHTVYLAYDFYGKDNPEFHPPGKYGFTDVVKRAEQLRTPQLNHVSLHLPSRPVIMQSEAALADVFCNQSSLAQQGRDCTREFCSCLHRVRVELGDVLQLVLVDEGAAFNANHPFHLHGHAFHVTAMQRLRSHTSVPEVRQLLERGLVPLRSLHAPLKDTVTVPDGGFTVLRLRASNPGVWLLHCHIGFHAEIGMGLVLQVGDWSSFKPPPRGFPTCGDWLPGLDERPPEQDLEDHNHVTLLRPGAASELVHYQVTGALNMTPLVLVQHMWPRPQHSSGHGLSSPLWLPVPFLLLRRI